MCPRCYTANFLHKIFLHIQVVVARVSSFQRQSQAHVQHDMKFRHKFVEDSAVALRLFCRILVEQQKFVPMPCHLYCCLVIKPRPIAILHVVKLCHVVGKVCPQDKPCLIFLLAFQQKRCNPIQHSLDNSSLVTRCHFRLLFPVFPSNSC